MKNEYLGYIMIREKENGNMDNLNDFLKLYLNLKDEDTESIIGLFTEETLHRNDYFLHKDKVCKKLSFIKNGILRIYSLVDGKEVTQWIATNGYFISDLESFALSTPARWNIQALTETTVYTISKEFYDKVGTLIPNWKDVENRFLIKCFTMMENRIFRHLSQTAEERYHSFFNENRELFNQIPLQYIASMLGMTPETLSRIRSKTNS